MALQASFCATICPPGSLPGTRCPRQPPPGRASLQHLQRTQRSRRRRTRFQQDCEREGPQSEPQRWLLLLGDSGPRWALCRESRARLSPRAPRPQMPREQRRRALSLAPGSRITLHAPHLRRALTSPPSWYSRHGLSELLLQRRYKTWRLQCCHAGKPPGCCTPPRAATLSGPASAPAACPKNPPCKPGPSALWPAFGTDSI